MSGALPPDEVQAILEARAAELARPPDEAAGPPGRTFVVVAVGAERYGIDIGEIREVRSVASVTRVPSVSPHWLGLANIRGALVPVLDLERYLGAVGGEVGQHPWPVIVVASGPVAIAVRIDEIVGVRVIADAEIGPSVVERDHRPRVHAGLTADLVAILDIEALLGDPSLEVRDDVG